VRAANEDQRIMEAAYYPIVNATVSGDYIPVSDVRRTQGTGSPQRSNDIVSSEIRAGGTYTWRVVDNGKTYGAVMRQRSAREINELLLHKLEGDVSRDMSRIQRNLQAIAAKHELLSKADNSAMENAATVQENLTGGLVSQLDFRLAQNAALEIRSGLLSLAYQENMARAEWDRATGRYFQFSVEPPQNVR
jgi:outer membrane protein TolC